MLGIFQENTELSDQLLNGPTLASDLGILEWGEITAPHYIPWVRGLPDVATNTLPSLPWSHPFLNIHHAMQGSPTSQLKALQSATPAHVAFPPVPLAPIPRCSQPLVLAELVVWKKQPGCFVSHK